VVYTAKRHSLFFRTGTLKQRTGEKDSIEGKAYVAMTTFIEGGFKKVNKINTIGKTIKNIEISKLNNGTYFTKCIFDNNIETIRFVKLK